MKVAATYSIKGGVGKTTCAVNLAHEAAASGARVLLWDLDPQGAATYCFRIAPKIKGGVTRLVGAKGALVPHVRATDTPALHVIPSDFSLRHLDLRLDAAKCPAGRLADLLEPLTDHYDLALLDCPPGISLSNESVFGATDALLIPVIPTPLSARTLAQLTEFLAGRSDRPAVLPHFSMVDRRKKLQRELVVSLAAQWPGFLTTVIPNASTIERMGTERAPVAAFAPRTRAAAAFRDLWAEVAAVLWR